MSKKRKKSSAAENLIESLMDDVKEIQKESSYHKDEPVAHFPLELTKSSIKSQRENTNLRSTNLWENLQKGISPDLDKQNQNDSPPVEDLLHNYSSELEESSPYEKSYSDYSAEGIGTDGEVPEGLFDSLPASEKFNGPASSEDRYDGPEASSDYQGMDDLFKSAELVSDEPLSPPPMSASVDDDSTKPVYSASSSAAQVEDKTVSIQQDPYSVPTVPANTDADKTIAVDGFANARIGRKKPADVKVSIGGYRGSRPAGNVMTSIDASLAQAENLKIAQQRILQLEHEVESLRVENEELASAGEIIRTRADEYAVRIAAVEKEKQEDRESAQSEILILKGNLQYKESEVAKARIKVEELETRLKSDFKKIRVRERELENRLELLRAEKTALVRSKDEYILDLKRKIDQLSMELDNYRKKCLELNKTLDANQDQFKRTERALRLALTNLEAKEENLAPLKKAE